MNTLCITPKRSKDSHCRANYLLVLNEDSTDSSCEHFLGAIDLDSEGQWIVTLNIDTLVGADDESPQCWSDVLVVCNTWDLLAAKRALKESASIHFQGHI